MRINEIFCSLQGEGFFTGRRAVFVRFSGCNLRCPFCDTDFQAFTEMSEQQIVAAVADYLPEEGGLVVLTGGEPSLQLTPSLVDALHAIGAFVSIETNGTHSLPANLDWITCSPKRNSRVILTRANELKVVFDGLDVESWRRQIEADHYFLQPLSCSNTEDVISYIHQHPVWRLSLQTHKLVGIR